MTEELRYYPQLMAEHYDHWQLYRELQSISDVVTRLQDRVEDLEQSLSHINSIDPPFTAAFGHIWMNHNFGEYTITSTGISFNASMQMNGLVDCYDALNVTCDTASSMLVIQKPGVYWCSWNGALRGRFNIRIHVYAALNPVNNVGGAGINIAGLSADLRTALGSDYQAFAFSGPLTLTSSDKLAMTFWTESTASVVFLHSAITCARFRSK